MTHELQPASPRPLRTRGRLSGHMYETVKTRLLQGAVPADGRLSVEALRHEFGVSKQPVMEALRQLAGDGLVEILPQIGCVVSTYSAQEASDFFLMFAGLEGAVAAVAASRCTPAALAELDSVSVRIRELSRNPDPLIQSKGYLTLNREFHESIHRMSGSRIISDTSRRMWDLSDFLINTGAKTPLAFASVETRQDDHDGIRQALAARDPEAAKSEMERHILETVDLLHPRALQAAGKEVTNLG